MGEQEPEVESTADCTDAPLTRCNPGMDRALMCAAVPKLWLDVLHMLGPRGEWLTELPIGNLNGTAELMLARLPDLAVVTPTWAPLAEKLFELLSYEKILPHAVEPLWIAPSESVGSGLSNPGCWASVSDRNSPPWSVACHNEPNSRSQGAGSSCDGPLCGL